MTMKDHQEALAEIKRLRAENRTLLAELRMAQRRIVELVYKDKQGG